MGKRKPSPIILTKAAKAAALAASADILLEQLDVVIAEIATLPKTAAK